jgi:hypothetical protein
MGSYVTFLDTTVTLYDQEAFETPTNPGVQFSDVFTVYVAGSGGDNSVFYRPAEPVGAGWRP